MRRGPPEALDWSALRERGKSARISWKQAFTTEFLFPLFSCLKADAVMKHFTRLHVSACNCTWRLTEMSKSSVLFKPFKHLTIRQKSRQKSKLFSLWEEVALNVTGKSFFNSSCLILDVSMAFFRVHSDSTLHTNSTPSAHQILKRACSYARCCAKIRASWGCTVEAASRRGQFLMEEPLLILEMFRIFLH